MTSTQSEDPSHVNQLMRTGRGGEGLPTGAKAVGSGEEQRGDGGQPSAQGRAATATQGSRMTQVLRRSDSKVRLTCQRSGRRVTMTTPGAGYAGQSSGSRLPPTTDNRTWAAQPRTGAGQLKLVVTDTGGRGRGAAAPGWEYRGQSNRGERPRTEGQTECQGSSGQGSAQDKSNCSYLALLLARVMRRSPSVVAVGSRCLAPPPRAAPLSTSF